MELRALHNSLCGEPGEGDGAVGGILLFAQTTVPEPTSEDGSPNTEDPTASITPLKRETSDPFNSFTAKLSGTHLLASNAYLPGRPSLPHLN